MSATDQDTDAEDDATLLLQADELRSVARYFAAAKLLRTVSDTSLLTDQHRRILALADKATLNCQLLIDSPTDSWMIQNSKSTPRQRQGRRDTTVYYQVTPPHNIITTKIVMPMEQSLLLPLLSVWNESQLHATWMPRTTVPVRLGMSASHRIAEWEPGHQVIQIQMDMPFPFSNRECLEHVTAVDAIDEMGKILVLVESVGAGFSLDDGNNANDTGQEEKVIGEPEKGYVRIDFDATISIEACPSDHPSLEHSTWDYQGEDRLLVSLASTINAHIAGVPMGLINFFTRTFYVSRHGQLCRSCERPRIFSMSLRS